MSKSLKIDKGDLSIGAGRAFETVSGSEKLGQDLKLWFLERIGTDPSTPNYGSKLDGGSINGYPIDSFIGQLSSEERLSEVRAEIANQLLMFQTDQLAKMKREATQFGQTTITADELLQRVHSIDVAQVGVTIIARIIVFTMADTSLKLTLPVEF